MPTSAPRERTSSGTRWAGVTPSFGIGQRALLVRAPDGTTKRVAALPAGWEAEALTWSGDGTELAWMAAHRDDFSQARVYRAAVSGSPVRHWDCELLCGLVAFLQ